MLASIFSACGITSSKPTRIRRFIFDVVGFRNDLARVYPTQWSFVMNSDASTLSTRQELSFIHTISSSDPTRHIEVNITGAYFDLDLREGPPLNPAIGRRLLEDEAWIEPNSIQRTHRVAGTPGLLRSNYEYDKGLYFDVNCRTVTIDELLVEMKLRNPTVPPASQSTISGLFQLASMLVRLMRWEYGNISPRTSAFLKNVSSAYVAILKPSPTMAILACDNIMKTLYNLVGGCQIAAIVSLSTLPRLYCPSDTKVSSNYRGT
ncbi:hypothetical protein DFS33DRAFT_1276238 [Desarmillaria ectypa]|nr:hypothetical protein DFS33DRAFT_1276238 [Desarmillaria ectypa]